MGLLENFTSLSMGRVVQESTLDHWEEGEIHDCPWTNEVIKSCDNTLEMRLWVSDSDLRTGNGGCGPGEQCQLIIITGYIYMIRICKLSKIGNIKLQFVWKVLLQNSKVYVHVYTCTSVLKLS